MFFLFSLISHSPYFYYRNNLHLFDLSIDLRRREFVVFLLCCFTNGRWWWRVLCECVVCLCVAYLRWLFSFFLRVNPFVVWLSKVLKISGDGSIFKLYILWHAYKSKEFLFLCVCPPLSSDTQTHANTNDHRRQLLERERVREEIQLKQVD